MIDSQSTFRIDAGRKRIGTPINVRPVGAWKDPTRLQLSTNDSNQIFFSPSTGNDTTGDGTRATPYETLGKCETEWTTGNVITCLDDEFIISDDITRPLQADIEKALKIIPTDSYTEVSGIGAAGYIGGGVFSAASGLWRIVDGEVESYSTSTQYTFARTVSGVSFIANYDTGDNVLEIAWISEGVFYEYSYEDIFINEIVGLFASMIGIFSTTTGAKVFLQTTGGIISCDVNVAGEVANIVFEAFPIALGAEVFQYGNDVYLHFTSGGTLPNAVYNIYKYNNLNAEFINSFSFPDAIRVNALYDTDKLYVGIVKFTDNNLTIVDPLTGEEYENIDDASIWFGATAIGDLSISRVDVSDEVSYYNPELITEKTSIAITDLIGVAVWEGQVYVRITGPTWNILDMPTIGDISGCKIYGPATPGKSLSNDFYSKLITTNPDIRNNDIYSKAEITSTETTFRNNLLRANLELDATGITAPNDIRVENNTIIGDIEVSTANLDEARRVWIADNNHVGSISSNRSGLVIRSGNQFDGTRTNVLYEVLSFNDPKFRNSDYELSRLLLGDALDSPLIGQSRYSVTPDGQPRDLGCYNIQDPAIQYEYTRSFYANRPNGGYKFLKRNAAKALYGLDATPDVTNVVDRKNEVLIVEMSEHVDYEHIEFQDYLDSLRDTTVRVDLYPDQATPTSIVTTDGEQASGSVFISIVSGTVGGGAYFEYNGQRYYIIYQSGLKLVLDRALSDTIPTATELSIVSRLTLNEYLYVPNTERELTYHSQEQPVSGGLVKGVNWRFVRKWPS